MNKGKVANEMIRIKRETWLMKWCLPLHFLPLWHKHHETPLWKSLSKTPFTGAWAPLCLADIIYFSFPLLFFIYYYLINKLIFWIVFLLKIVFFVIRSVIRSVIQSVIQSVIRSVIRSVIQSVIQLVIQSGQIRSNLGFVYAILLVMLSICRSLLQKDGN